MEIGFYVRIARDGKFQAVDVADMTEAELEVWSDTLDEDRARAWVRTLVKWIQTNVQEAPNA